MTEVSTEFNQENNLQQMTKQQLNILQGKYKPQFLLTWKNEFKTKYRQTINALNKKVTFETHISNRPCIQSALRTLTTQKSLL